MIPISARNWQETQQIALFAANLERPNQFTVAPKGMIHIFFWPVCLWGPISRVLLIPTYIENDIDSVHFWNGKLSGIQETTATCPPWGGKLLKLGQDSGGEQLKQWIQILAHFGLCHAVRGESQKGHALFAHLFITTVLTIDQYNTIPVGHSRLAKLVRTVYAW